MNERYKPHNESSQLGCSRFLADFVANLFRCCYFKILTVRRNFLVVQSKPNFPDITICNLFLIPDFKSYLPFYEKYLEKLQFVRDQAPDGMRSIDVVWRFYQAISTFNLN